MSLNAFSLAMVSVVVYTRGNATEVPKVSARLYISSYPNRLWPNGTIYYDVDPYIHTNKIMLTSVQKAIEYLNDLTCFKWIQRYPWQDLPHVVTFLMYEDRPEKYLCATNIGFLKEAQHIIYLGRNCYIQLRIALDAYRLVDKYFTHPALHEMVHVMGLAHEHQRPDRDCYIWVADEISYQTGWKRYFWTDLKADFPYDYHSITHYSGTYSKVHPHDPKYGLTVGRYSGTLSDFDVWKLERLYCARPRYCETFPLECEAAAMAKRQNPNCTRLDNVKPPNAG